MHLLYVCHYTENVLEKFRKSIRKALDFHRVIEYLRNPMGVMTLFHLGKKSEVINLITKSYMSFHQIMS